MEVKPTGQFYVDPKYIDPDNEVPAELRKRIAQMAGEYIDGTFSENPATALISAGESDAKIFIYMTGFDRPDGFPPSFTVCLRGLIRDFAEEGEPQASIQLANHLEECAKMLRNAAEAEAEKATS